MQELSIILAILIGAIWLLVKILKGLAVAVEAVSKGIDEAAVLRKKHRYEKRRGRLRQYVHALIPNELGRFEKEFEATKREFKQAKTHRWTPTAPEWTKERR